MVKWQAMEISRAAESLSGAIRFQTVSRLDYSVTDPAPFRAFESWLARRYPLCAKSLGMKRVGEWGILFSWRGGDPLLKPFLLMAHYDVVDSGEGWTKVPWAGEISGGFVWGRGAFDDKLVLVSVMDAAESLLREGFSPRQGFAIALGGDEEVGGSRGAAAIGAFLAERGLSFEFCVDEGGAIMEGALPFLTRPAALIGLAEKGHVNIELSARGKSGHASAPGRDQAVLRLAKAISALGKRPFPVRMTDSLSAFLRAAAEEADFPLSFILSRPRFFSGAIAASLGGNPQAAAMFRTTLAFTMLQGSGKENVLPDAAKANVNARIIPGESIASCLDAISRVVGKFGVEASVKDWGQANEPLPESSSSSKAYARISALLRKAVPACVPMPYLVTVGTDTRHYLPVCDSAYRITPALLDSGELARMHSYDERVSLENIDRCVEFYRGLMKGGADEQGGR
jgi:carboxypeptidase PM20D1